MKSIDDFMNSDKLYSILEQFVTVIIWFIVILTLLFFIGSFMYNRDWKGFGSSNLFSSTVSIADSKASSIIPFIIDRIGIILKEIGSFIVNLLSAISQPLDTVLKYVLWVIFFIAVTMCILYFFGVINTLPDFRLKTPDGTNMSYTEKKSNDDMNIFEKISQYFINMFKQTRSSIALSMGVDINIPKEGDSIKRKELMVGRCNEIDFVTNGNNCISNKRVKDITWSLNGESEDYAKLPPKFKNQDMEKITIPFSEAGGFYYPDCNRSYYTETGVNTNLLTNVTRDKCAYVDVNMKKYSS